MEVIEREQEVGLLRAEDVAVNAVDFHMTDNLVIVGVTDSSTMTGVAVIVETAVDSGTRTICNVANRKGTNNRTPPRPTWTSPLFLECTCAMQQMAST